MKKVIETIAMIALCIILSTQAQAQSTINAINVSAGQFGANTGGGDYSFPGSIKIRNIRMLFFQDNLETIYLGPGGGNNTGAYNTFLGIGSGESNLDGFGNTAIGNRSLFKNKEGALNTAVGKNCLTENFSGLFNTAIGGYALNSITMSNCNVSIGAGNLSYAIGDGNVSIGFKAAAGIPGESNINNNTTIGTQAGTILSSGADKNVIIGAFAGDSIGSGSNNIVIGYKVNTLSPTSSYQLNIGNALYGDLLNGNIGIGTFPGQKLDIAGNININTNGDNLLISTLKAEGTSGNNLWIGGGGLNIVGDLDHKASNNTAIGQNSLLKNTEGYENSACGANSLEENTTGRFNSAFGTFALQKNTGGEKNTCIGHWSGSNSQTGNNNTGLGFQTLYSNESGVNNTAIGSFSLIMNKGSNNTTGGHGALMNLEFGDNNTTLGSKSATNLKNGSGNTFIGANINTSQNMSNTVILADGNGLARLYSDSIGNTGIGTINPTEKLEVLGMVKADGFIGNFFGAVNATNISAGNFGENTGGGNYNFPADISVGGDILVSGIVFGKKASPEMKEALTTVQLVEEMIDNTKPDYYDGPICNNIGNNIFLHQKFDHGLLVNQIFNSKRCTKEENINTAYWESRWEGDDTGMETIIEENNILPKAENFSEKNIVYPNPFTDEITINLPEFIGEKVTLSVFNSSSQLLYQQELVYTGEKKLNTNLYQRGLYVFQISSASKSREIKGIKN